MERIPKDIDQSGIDDRSPQCGSALDLPPPSARRRVEARMTEAAIAQAILMGKGRPVEQPPLTFRERRERRKAVRRQIDEYNQRAKDAGTPRIREEDEPVIFELEVYGDRRLIKFPSAEVAPMTYHPEDTSTQSAQATV